MNKIDAFDVVEQELCSATTKFPFWPSDPLHALAVLGEEYGELNQAILQLMYEPEKSSLDHVKEEAVQTAAMAIRLLMSVDDYDYDNQCQQIVQDP